MTLFDSKMLMDWIIGNGDGDGDGGDYNSEQQSINAVIGIKKGMNDDN